MEAKPERTPHAATLAVFGAMVTTVALEAVRVMLPVGYHLREAQGLQQAVLVALAVFVAPIVAPLVVRLAGVSRALFGCAVVLGAARIAVQFVRPVPVTLAAFFAAVGLVALAVVVLCGRSHGLVLTLGVVAGLALDTVVRGTWTTWDPSQRTGGGADAVGVALAAGLIVAGWWVHRAAPRGSDGGAVFAGLAMGAFLALQVLVLQNPAFVDASASLALAGGVAVVLLADALALLLLATSGWRALPTVLLVVLGIVLVVLAWWSTVATGAPFVALVLVAQPAAVALLLATLAATEPEWTRHGTASAAGLGLGLGSVLFGLLVIGYQLHYEQPLPFSNRWLPAAAASVLAVVGCMRARADAQAGEHTVWAWRAAVAVTVVAGVVFAGLSLTAPSLDAVAEPSALRVMTYNVHESVTRDGQVDPAPIAEATRRSHADLVVLQEVPRGWPLSSDIDLAEWAQRELGMRFVWAPAADQQFGNLLLSRVPIRAARVLPLTPAAGRMDRSAVIATVGPVGGKLVTVVGVHLQEGEATPRVEARRREIREVTQALGAATRVVLVGDFNPKHPGLHELQRVLDAGFTTTAPVTRCVLTTSNQHCSDWIFVRSGLEQGKTRTLPIDTYDHRPVVATVTPLR
jgi:endonuclease/exonuclease/phosphatase family metal-dependent hydrolase